MATRLFKRGIAFSIAHGCDVLNNHESSSWWYSWKDKAGFSRGYCDDPLPANAHGRDNLGMEFVPMFWGGPPSQPFDDETEENLQKASYLLTMNEPEREDQSNITPNEAAIMWPEIVSIANNYNLPIVAPCTTSSGNAFRWTQDWLSECSTMYGEPCAYDYTCVHMYLYPYPCDGVELPANDRCAGKDGEEAMNRVNDWYNEFGKPVWVTEFACNAGLPCDEASNLRLMEQLVPLFDASDRVFRYAWFSANRRPGNTNDRAWEPAKNETCVEKIWLTEAEMHGDCYRTALQNPTCHTPLNLVYDEDVKECYCSTDACIETLPSYLTVLRQDTSKDGSKLTSLGDFYQTVGITEAPTKAPVRITEAPTKTPVTERPTPKALECSPSESNFKFFIVTDNRGFDLRYTLKEITIDGETIGKPILSDENLPSNVNVIDETCISSSSCYMFKIIDDRGDGICCSTSTGNGMYEISVDGKLSRYGLTKCRHILI